MFGFCCFADFLFFNFKFFVACFPFFFVFIFVFVFPTLQLLFLAVPACAKNVKKAGKPPEGKGSRVIQNELV